MLKSWQKGEWNRFFFYDSPFRARLRFPLIISLLFHGLIASLAFFSDPDLNMVNDFSVRIESVESRMEAIKKMDKFVADRDSSPNNSQQQQSRTFRSLENDSLYHNPGNRTSDVQSKKNSFFDDYEKTLFGKKKTPAGDLRNLTQDDSKTMVWEDEEVSRTDRKKKNVPPEKSSGSSGGVRSTSIVWKEGYSRKIIYQPDIEYPLYYRKQGIQGTVVVQIRVDKNGNVVGADIVRSSGYSRLDILGRKGVLKARFSRKEASGTGTDIAEIEVQFRLER